MVALGTKLIVQGVANISKIEEGAHIGKKGHLRKLQKVVLNQFLKSELEACIPLPQILTSTGQSLKRKCFVIPSTPTLELKYKEDLQKMTLGNSNWRWNIY